MNAPLSWFVYMIRCRNGTLYTGISTDVERRFAEHQSGGPRAARYLRGKGPLELVYRLEAGDRARASALEYRLKRLDRAAKLRLVAGDSGGLDWLHGSPERLEHPEQ